MSCASGAILTAICCNQATSDDLLQEIWFALARNAASLESGTRFRTRLFTRAHDRMTEIASGTRGEGAFHPPGPVGPRWPPIRRTRSRMPSGNYPANSAKPIYCKSKAN